MLHVDSLLPRQLYDVLGLVCVALSHVFTWIQSTLGFITTGQNPVDQRLDWIASVSQAHHLIQCKIFVKMLCSIFERFFVQHAVCSIVFVSTKGWDGFVLCCWVARLCVYSLDALRCALNSESAAGSLQLRNFFDSVGSYNCASVAGWYCIPNSKPEWSLEKTNHLFQCIHCALDFHFQRAAQKAALGA